MTIQLTLAATAALFAMGTAYAQTPAATQMQGEMPANKPATAEAPTAATMPATPATPAQPGVSTASPATPATPATPAAKPVYGEGWNAGRCQAARAKGETVSEQNCPTR
ncbi:MAG: hypothetical protein ACXW3D_09775 [Caulobacteraceae bacterium]